MEKFLKIPKNPVFDNKNFGQFDKMSSDFFSMLQGFENLKLFEWIKGRDF